MYRIVRKGFQARLRTDDNFTPGTVFLLVN